jgi:hypothetical protein
MQIAELWVQNDIAMAGCQNWVCRCPPTTHLVSSGRLPPKLPVEPLDEIPPALHMMATVTVCHYNLLTVMVYSEECRVEANGIFLNCCHLPSLHSIPSGGTQYRIPDLFGLKHFILEPCHLFRTEILF